MPHFLISPFPHWAYLTPTFYHPLLYDHTKVLKLLCEIALYIPVACYSIDLVIEWQINWYQLRDRNKDISAYLSFLCVTELCQRRSVMP